MAKRTRTSAAESGVEYGDVIALRGCIEMQLMDAFGKPVADRVKLNTIMTAGRAWVLQKIVSSTNATNAINAIAIGTSTATLNASNTALASEVTASLGRKTIGTVDATNITSTTPSWAANVLFATNEANNTLGEVGLFNTSSATAGTMFARATFGTIDKTTSNTLAVTYTISN